MKMIKTINTELGKLAVISMDENEPQVITEVLENELFFTLELSALINDVGVEEALVFNALRALVHVDCESNLFYVPANANVLDEIINFLHDCYFTLEERDMSAMELKYKPIAKNIISCLRDVRWNARYDGIKK